MKTQFLTTSQAIIHTVSALARTADDWSFCIPHASARLGEPRMWGELEPHFSRLRHAIVGLEMHLSDPCILEKWHALGKLRVIVSAEGVLQARVFAFRSADSFSALVGAANCGETGEHDPYEAAVLTTCDPEDEFAHGVEGYLAACLKRARLVTSDELKWYAHDHMVHSESLARARQLTLRDTEPMVEIVEPHDVSRVSLVKDSIADPPLVTTVKVIENLDCEEVLAAFRQTLRGRSSITQAELLRDVARRFGYERVGKTIGHILKGHLRAAIRRRVVTRDGDALRLDTNALGDYSPDEIEKCLMQVLRPSGKWFECEDVMRQVANYYGFMRVNENVKDVMNAVFKRASRRRIAEVKGLSICRRE